MNSKEARRNYDKEYYQRNRNKILKRKKDYYIRNRERFRGDNKQYYENNRQRILEQKRQHRKNNHQRYLERGRKYRLGHSEERKKYCKDHREQGLQSVRKWQMGHPQKARELDLRHQNKRKRNLGFNPLNKSFEGATAHHINRTEVIYIPEELHKSIPHCLETGRNMKKINRFAINFVKEGSDG